VFRIETEVAMKMRDGTIKHRSEIHFGVTSLQRNEADRKRLLELVRGHWSIENKVHWVRDVTFDEDRSQVRVGNAPQMMAALRNLALSVLRIAGARNIAKATRHCAAHPHITARLLGVRVAA
jgi:predicted transposase YbfD/YdcC